MLFHEIRLTFLKEVPLVAWLGAKAKHVNMPYKANISFSISDWSLLRHSKTFVLL